MMFAWLRTWRPPKSGLVRLCHRQLPALSAGGGTEWSRLNWTVLLCIMFWINASCPASVFMCVPGGSPETDDQSEHS
eukprot:scaffold56836_cov24-Tisochrysis_lutea.AAC.1